MINRDNYYNNSNTFSSNNTITRKTEKYESTKNCLEKPREQPDHNSVTHKVKVDEEKDHVLYTCINCGSEDIDCICIKIITITDLIVSPLRTRHKIQEYHYINCGYIYIAPNVEIPKWNHFGYDTIEKIMKNHILHDCKGNNVCKSAIV